MSTTDLVEFIESKRYEAIRLLTRLSAEKSLKMDSATMLHVLNDRLANNLSLSFGTGEEPDKDLRLYPKPMNLNEMAARMRYLIEDDELGSKHPRIRRVAMDQIETASKNLGIPLPVRVVSRMEVVENPFPLPPEMYRSFLSTEDEVDERRMLMRHCAVGAEAVYGFVRTKVHSVAEGSENFQRAHHTLMVEGGDCDDVAILIGSLLVSVGYAVYVQFLPGHVFAGVVLGRIGDPVLVQQLPAEDRKRIPRDCKSVYPTEYVMVPLDMGSFRLLNHVFDVFDIFNRRTERIIGQAIDDLRSVVQNLPMPQRAENFQLALHGFVDTELENVSTEIAKLSAKSDRFSIGARFVGQSGHVKEISDLFGEQVAAALRREGIPATG